METSTDWIVPDWPAPSRVKSVITSRNGGVSIGGYANFNLGTNCGDDTAAVAENRRRLREYLPQEPLWLRQVHGTQVIDADTAAGESVADASIARKSGTVCAVLVADCLPVLLCSRNGDVVGVAHSGWRGLSAGVIEATVQRMGTPPRELMAYLGPAIGATVFEVGAEVRAAFLAVDPAAAGAFAVYGAGKWLADLWKLARLRLTRLGVSDIFGGGLCTYSEALRFYSYRRDKVTGRMAALIWLA